MVVMVADQLVHQLRASKYQPSKAISRYNRMALHIAGRTLAAIPLVSASNKLKGNSK